ncbi:LacI family DNA-binding transcriptional regulator [Cellulomonas sp. MW4]|uniref:LacI family DNA-binding transcriptional regulator n=2 Tax=Cellulomonas alba TaxID=3053467 RepID=A0ABT7SGA4_9CELL|nr:LacI family DNA-binding transcriptional regulator [Cellulomonas alba]MDM7855213.1 LacI family DNA-binding transcriptional regulator [Cellulomonas alba]
MTDATSRRGAGPGRVASSIGDVARLAGVSTQTVSRVAHGAPSVRDETRRRVLDAMDRLGYSPNAAARALRSGASGTIGVIAHQLARTGESRTVEAVVEAARREGYTVSLVDVQTPGSDDVSAAVQRLSHQTIDGLVIIRAETATPTTLALPRRLPVVAVDSRFVGHHPAVGADQAGGAAAAVQHLLDLRHATVHHLAGPAASVPASSRVDGWRDALVRTGRRVPPVVVGDWSAESGYALASELLADPELTAVFCGNDEMASGLLLALHERGVRVPQDVSVVGFDDIPLARFLWPPLTTVRQDFAAIGERLVELLLAQVRDGAVLANRHVTVPAPLVVRASTGPARASGAS